jgi:acyl carrier protein
VFSSKSCTGLNQLLDNFLEWLDDSRYAHLYGNGLFDMASTLAEGRPHGQTRLAVLSNDVIDLVEKIRSYRHRSETGNGVFCGVADKMKEGVVFRGLDRKEAAIRWVEGETIDWVSLRNGKRYRRCPLPGYVFDRKRFFAAARSGEMHGGKGTGGGTAGRAREYSVKEISDFLIVHLSRLLSMDSEHIEVNRTFDEFGMDSIAVISLVRGLEDFIGRELTIQSMADIQTIERLSRYCVLGAEKEACVDLISETELDEFLFVKGTPLAKTKNKAIFLTGSTGYLGSYLLRELLEQTDGDVYCLVRAENCDSGFERIRQAARQHGVAYRLNESRIHVVPGDLGEWRLGLERKEFNRLCGLIDTIWHCGATVD